MTTRGTGLTDWRRNALGFDSFFNQFESAINSTADDYIPYNIVKVDESLTRVELAVAGFKLADISIVVENEQLTIKGEKEDRETSDAYIHKGIADRPFTKVFQMSEHTDVLSAAFVDGMLLVTVQKTIPEALQPKRIVIEEGPL